MASLGELTARAILDIAGFSNPLKKMEKDTKDAADKISGHFMDIGKKMGGMVAGVLAGVAGAQAIMQQFAQAIDVADQLNDLSTATGVTVEALDELSTVAKLNNIDITDLTKGFKEMNKSIVESHDPSSKAATIFGAIGINLDKLRTMKPEDQLKEILSKFNEYGDSAERAQAMTEIFGKQAGNLTVMMKNMAGDTQTAKENIEAFGGVTTQSAAAAGSIKDNIDLLSRGFTGALQPAIIVVSDFMSKMYEVFKEFGGETQIVGELVANILVFGLKVLVSAVIAVITPVTTLITAIRGLSNVIGMLASNDWAGAMDAAKKAINDTVDAANSGERAINKLWQEQNKATEATKAGNKSMADYNALNKAWLEQEKFKADLLKRDEKAQQDAAAAAKKHGDEMKKVVETWRDFIAADGDKRLIEYNNKMQQLNEQVKEQPKEINLWTIAQLKLTAAFVQFDMDKINKEAEKMNENFKSMAKPTDDWAKAGEEAAKEMMKVYDELVKQEKQMGLTTAQIRIANIEAARVALISRMEVTPTLEKEINTWADRAKAVAGNITKMEDAEIASQNWAKTLDTLDSYGGSLFQAMGDGMEGLSKWAKQAGADIKKFLLDMLYQATLKPFIISIVGGMAGGAGASTGAGSPFGAAAGAGGGGAFGGLTNMASGLMSAGGAVMAGFETLAFVAADTAGIMASGVGAIEAFSMASAAAGMTMAAMVPVVGAIAVAAYLAYSYFSEQGGGPKKGGATKNAALGGVDLFPGETGSEGNKVVKDIVGTIDKSYAAIMKSLGGKGVAIFGMAYDTDPEGKANNRLNAAAMVNGQNVYTYKSGDQALGRDMEDLSTAMEVQAKRMLLAALQASDLPADIAKIMNSVDAASVTSEGLDRLLMFSQAVGSVNNMLMGIDKLPEVFDEMMKPVTEMTVFRDAGNNLDDLMEKYDGSADATIALSTATSDYYKSMVALELQIRKVAQEADKMFSDTSKDINLYGRDWAYMQEYYTKQWTKGMGDLATETDPAKIAEIASSINDGIMNAFNAVDMSDWKPEDVEARRQLFMGYAADANTAVQARLKLIGDDVLANTKTEMQVVHDMLMDAATGINTAAGNMVDASNKPLTATVEGPMDVVIVGDTRSSEVTG